MKIGGFQKTSLLDYPKKISTIIWTVGCNFRCPFCYNKDIVQGNVELVPEEEIFDYLKKRKEMIEALVITGGEPLMHKDISDFCKKVKQLGYLIKIDTNGTFPDRLKQLIDEKLVDYIAMDVKAPQAKYDTLTGVKTPIKKIKRSINIIKKSNVDYEFRTTFISKYLNEKDIIEVAKWLEGANSYFIQQFKNNVPMISKELEFVKPYNKEEIINLIGKIKPYFQKCSARGV